MNIGILTPRSNVYPSMGVDIVNGLKLFFKQQQAEGDMRIYAESIGFGGTEKEVYDKAEKLLLIDDVDILLAYIDERVLLMLKPLIYSSNKLVIVMNPGANYPLNWVPQDNIITLTLQHAFCQWLTGTLAAGETQQKAATASTFYDCGYLHSSALVKSYTKHGGAISYNYINNSKYDDSFTITPLTDHLKTDATTRTLLCTLDALPASLFYSILNTDEAAKDLHLLVSPMMLEPKALANRGEGFSFYATGHTPWQATTENEANTLFKATLEANKKNPNIFSLLGWEAGMLALHVSGQANGDYTDGAALGESCKGVAFSSPRGTLRLDEETNFFLAPINKCVLAPGTKDIDTTIVDDYKKEWKNFTEEPSGGVISGWTNTYLCY